MCFTSKSRPEQTDLSTLSVSFKPSLHNRKMLLFAEIYLKQINRLALELINIILLSEFAVPLIYSLKVKTKIVSNINFSSKYCDNE